MKVKVGNKVFDSKHEPVLIILTPKDKAYIADMDSGEYKYCAFPENVTDVQKREWMDYNE